MNTATATLKASTTTSNRRTSTFDLHSRKVTRTPNQPLFVPGVIDPVQTRESKSVSPLKLVTGIAGMVVAAAVSTPVYEFLTAHNDQIVTGMLYAMPVILVAALGVATRIMMVWRQNKKLLLAYEASVRSGLPMDAVLAKFSESKNEDKTSIESASFDPALRPLPAKRVMPQVSRRPVVFANLQQAA